MEIFQRGLSKKELNEILKDGIISQEQALQISHKFPKKYSSNFFLQIFAYTFLALSVFVIVAANWLYLSREVKSAVLIGFLLTSGFGAFFVKNSLYSQILGFLSNFIFAANIFFISQMFNLGDDKNLGFMTISYFALLSSFVFRSNLIFAQAYAFAIIWHYFSFYDYGYNLAFYLPFVIIALYKLYKENTNLLAFINFFGIVILIFALFDHRFLNNEIFSWILVFSILTLSYKKDWFIFKFSAKSLAFVIVYFYCFSAFFYSNFIWSDYQILALVLTLFFAGKCRNLPIVLVCCAILLYKNLYLIGSKFDLSLDLLFFISSSIFALTIIAICILYIKFGEQKQKIWAMFSMGLLGLILYTRLIGDYIGASLMFVVFAVILILASKSKK